MWEIITQDNQLLYKNGLCQIKVLLQDHEADAYINYKGYNMVMPLSFWGFEDDLQERKIRYSIEGVKSEANTFFYRINKSNIRLFCDLVYFFLKEHRMDRALNDLLKFKEW